jgi:uncharacterized protein
LDIAQQLRGFGPLGILAILLILLIGNTVPLVPASALLVLAWARLSHTPLREIGYVRPRSWVLTVAAGIVFGIAFKLVMKAIVMPPLGADPVNHAYHYLVGNSAGLPAAIWTFIVVGGFGEETVYRGFLFERLGKVLGSSAWAKTPIVVLTAALFGLGHYYDQKLAGLEQALITGTVFGTIFAVTGRIFLPMIAHAAFDLAALAIIYWDLETAVAHAIFK